MTDSTTPTALPTGIAAMVLPTLSEVPRESAQEMVECANRIAGVVETWAPLAVTAGDFADAAVMRRTVAALADTIERRDLSTAATIIAQRAARRVERVLGLTVSAGQAAGLIVTPGQPGAREGIPTVRDVTGIARPFPLTVGVTDEQFEAALAAASAAGSCSLTMVEAALAGVPLRAERETEPPPPPLETTNAIGMVVDKLDKVAATVGRIDLSTLAGLDPAVAADTAARMWTALVPVMHLRKGLERRGRE